MTSNLSKQNTALLLFRVVAYLLAVLLVLLTFSVLCAEDAVTIIPTDRGVSDLQDFDFADSIARIPPGDTSVIYPGAFYTREDFAAGNVIQEGNTGSAHGDFGTIRMVLLLPPDEVYAISAKSVSYAQRLFVDGREIGVVGNPAAAKANFTPGNRRYVAGFYAREEATEIILHYAVFIHADGGGRFPMLIGSVENIARAEQLRTLLEGVQAAALLTALLFFFGLYLFFPGRRYLLWFALLCGCIAVRLLGAANNASMLLFPEIDFTLYLRLEYIVTCCIGITSAMYINALFPGAVSKWVMRGFASYCAAVCLFLGFAPTILFTRFPVPLSLSYVAFVAALMLAVLAAALRGRMHSAMTKAEGLLLLAGMGLYVAFSGVAVIAHQKMWRLFGWEYQGVGILVFLFLNVLALTLIFSRTERALDAAQLAEREIRETNELLERLDKLKDDFFANISHEIKTPLAVIGNCAGRTLSQYRKGTMNRETETNLEIMENEAVRLGRMMEQLLDVAVEQDRQLMLTGTNVKTVLNRAAEFCAPVCKGRHNRITVRCEPAQIPLRVNADDIYRILVNLIVNANRQMENGVIALAAEYGGEPQDMVMFTVSDRGGGIPPHLLPHVLERGVSGSGGKGLGLAICKEIVERHGGRIAVENIDGGVQVCFALPCTGGEGNCE